MMADTAKPMHRDFARWYGAVSIGEDSVRRQARWQGVLSVILAADRSTVEALVRLAFGGRSAPLPIAVSAIRQAFKSADDAFEMSGNDRELQVLAGACLAVLVEDTTRKTGATAAMAVTTAALGGARKPNLPMNLAALGEAGIVGWSEANRKRPQLGKHVAIEPLKVDFENAAAKVLEQTDWEGVAAAFRLASTSVQAVLNTLAERQATMIREVADFIHIQDEELQMLWWLIGQRSEDYDCAFDAVPADAQPLVFASELATSTQALPGPASVVAILSRAGLKMRKKVPITAAVNAPRTEWLQKLMAGVDPSPVSTPLHFAINRQLETGAGDAWVAGWAAHAGIDATFALPSLTLSELFYRERLLVLFD